MRAKQLRRDKTPAERMLWSVLRRRQLDGVKFRDQHIVAGFLVDFFAPEPKLAIELDGPIHAHQRDYDEDRSNCLRRLGVTVIRFTNEAVLTDLAGTLETIRSALARPATRPPISTRG